MSLFGRDVQAQAGDLPGAGSSGIVSYPEETYPGEMGPGMVNGGAGQINGGILTRLFDGLRELFRSCVLYNVPKPFDNGQIDVFVTVLNTAVQLDAIPSFKLQHRRAWGVLNADPVLGNDIFVSFWQPTAANQGGRVLAQGGSLSIPGGTNMDVWMWPVAAGSPVYFYQFS